MGDGSNKSNKKYRIWSLRSQDFLGLKENGSNAPTADCTATEEVQSSKLHSQVCHAFVIVAPSDFCCVIIIIVFIIISQIKHINV